MVRGPARNQGLVQILGPYSSGVVDFFADSEGFTWESGTMGRYGEYVDGFRICFW